MQPGQSSRLQANADRTPPWSSGPTRGFGRKLAGDFVRLSPGIMAELVGGLGMVVLLGRLLPPAEMGEFVLYWAGQSYVSTASSGWLRNAAIRMIPEDPTKFGAYYRMSAHFLGWLLLACAAAGAASYTMLGPAVASAVVAASAVVWGAVGYGLFESLLRGLFRYRSYTIAAFVMVSVRLSAIEVFVPRSEAPIVAALLSVAAGYLAALAIQWWVCIRSKPESPRERRGKTNQPELRFALGYGLPLSVSAFLLALLRTSDRYLVAGLVGMAATGVYGFWMGVGDQLARGLSTFGFTLINPRLFELLGREPATARIRVRQLTELYVGTVIPLMGFAAAVTPLAFRMLGIKGEYWTHAYLMGFGAASASCLGLAQLVGKEHEFTGRTQVFAFGALIGLVALWLVDLVSIRFLGIAGAAGANVLAFAAYSVVVSRGHTWNMRPTYVLAVGLLAAAFWLVPVWGLSRGLELGIVTTVAVGACTAGWILSTVRRTGRRLAVQQASLTSDDGMTCRY